MIKVFLRIQRLDLFCLQETKVQMMIEGLVRSLGSSRFLSWEALDAVGIAGGVLIVWDKRSLELVDKVVGLFFVSCKFRSLEDGFIWVFTGGLWASFWEGRYSFWEELGAIRGLWENLWCIGGDFNVIQFPCERNMLGGLNSTVPLFSEVIDDLELVDLPLLGGSFTWSGGL